MTNFLKENEQSNNQLDLTKVVIPSNELSEQILELSCELKAREDCIALLEGKLCVGLTAEQLEFLGTAKEVWKVSLRDMPFVVSKKIAGATTVRPSSRCCDSLHQ